MTTIGAPEVVVWLELESSSSRLRVDQDGATKSLPLPVGTSHVVALFRRDPPTEGELEAAIQLIEDAVMPLAKLMLPAYVLVAASELAHKLVGLIAGSTARQVVWLDAVEARFEQVALAASRGAWSPGDGLDPSLAAGLLILREFMHHAGFDSIELRGDVVSWQSVQAE